MTALETVPPDTGQEELYHVNSLGGVEDGVLDISRPAGVGRSEITVRNNRTVQPKYKCLTL